MSRSLILVKPDATKRGLSGQIIGRIESQGLKLLGMKMLWMDRTLAGRHYAVHEGKAFYNDLVDYITSKPIVAAVFEGDDAVARIRKIMGATDPAKADKGTIRKDFGLNLQENAIHGSDSDENAKKEISLFFCDDELFNY